MDKPIRIHRLKNRLMIKLFGLYIYLANMPLRPKCHNDRYKASRKLAKIKAKAVENGARCAICGCDNANKDFEQHHIFPVSKFPELILEERNLMMLCPNCHYEVHNNPFLNCKVMTEQAINVGVDIVPLMDVPLRRDGQVQTEQE